MICYPKQIGPHTKPFVTLVRRARCEVWLGQRTNPNLLPRYREHAEQTVFPTCPRGANKGRPSMDILYPHCAGLDVHKDSVVACIRHTNAAGPARTQVRTFATVTTALLALLDWLLAEGVTHVAMESTGVYWKPLFNLLEGPLQVILVNAHAVKQVPGRKTDVGDAAWLAQLLQHGLLKASFVPPRPIRDLRDLTRQRTQLAAEKASAANRIQKVLEDANIKLASVATDVLGVSGRRMLAALIAGQDDPEALAELAQRRLRAKIPQLREALRGRLSDHHRFLLGLHLEHIEQLEKLLEQLTRRIAEHLDPPSHGGGDGGGEETASASSAAQTVAEPARPGPLEEGVRRLMTIPGVGRQTAEVIVAEIGVDMTPFATAAKLASWAGLCPGNDQSAGKRRSSRVPFGNRWLRQALVQAAWSAGRCHDSYLSAQYRQLARRRGRKRAAVAVAHTLLGISYHLLKRGTCYQDLGPAYLERLAPERLTSQLVRRLERLGHKVTLEPMSAA
jgi:transposase